MVAQSPVYEDKIVNRKNALTKTSDGLDAGRVVVGQETGADPIPVEAGPYNYVEAPVSATTILGTTGAAGDFLHTVTVRTNGTGSFSLKDGTDTLISFVGITGVNYLQTFTVDAVCVDSWQITNTSGVTALATGRFT